MLEKLRADLEAIIERDPAAGHKLAAYFYIKFSRHACPSPCPSLMAYGAAVYPALYHAAC